MKSAFCALALMLCTPAFAEDIAAGEGIYRETCRNCHGPTAKGMASFPNLVDSSAEHLTERLEQYRAQEKIGPNSPLMWPLAEVLSDDDIASVVAYITEGID